MRGIKQLFLFALVALSAFLSCTTSYQARSVQYADYRVANNQPDSSLMLMMRPYGDSVRNSMSDVIAVSEIELERKQPEGTLGNLLADASLAMARLNYKQHVDAAFLNEGGIRLPSISAGNISRGKIFELAPFDNVLLLLKINGKVLQQFLDHVSKLGGWPCAGISWQIKDKKAVNVMIAGAPLNEGSTYTIATNDYIANGGDDCSMLRPLPQVNNGYLFRDAVIDYFTQFTKAGKKLWVKIENRVTNAE